MKILCLVLTLSVLLTNAFHLDGDIKPTKPNKQPNETQQKGFGIKPISNGSRIVLRNHIKMNKSRNDKFRKNYDYYSNYGAANNFAMNSEYNIPNYNLNPNEPARQNVPVNNYNQHGPRLTATPEIKGLGENLGKLTKQYYDYYGTADGQAQRMPDQDEEYNNYGKNSGFNESFYPYYYNYGRQGEKTTDPTITDFTTTDTSATDIKSDESTTTPPTKSPSTSIDPELTNTDTTDPESTNTELTDPDSRNTDPTDPKSTNTETTDPESTNTETTDQESTNTETTYLKSTTRSRRTRRTTTRKPRSTIRTTPGPTPDTWVHENEKYGILVKNKMNLYEPYQLINRDKFVDLEEQPLCDCPRVYWPACGTDGITYLNVCIMNCIGKTFKRYGTCMNY